MAHANIDKRRLMVAQLLGIGPISTQEMRAIAKQFNCSYAAVYADVATLQRSADDRRPMFPTVKVKNLVFDRDAHTCQYCGVTDRRLIADHVVPMFQGGPGLPYNLVAACEPCNGLKSGKTVVPKNIDVLRALNSDWADYIVKKASDSPGRPGKYGGPTVTVTFRVPKAHHGEISARIRELLKAYQK
jgi:hypothetical protein